MADVVTVERFIPAPAPAIFALLADPARHRDIDGSGTVQQPEGDDRRLVLGSEFGMSMKMGVPYSMVSTVIEYEPDRRIAWQSGVPGRIGGERPAGGSGATSSSHAEGGTLVRETWDITGRGVGHPARWSASPAKKTEANMIATLERIEELLTT